MSPLRSKRGRAPVHGMTGTPEFTAWKNMKSRCSNPKVREYARYGGRGIKVCDRWLHSFQTFYADMGALPTRKHTIDRIDNDGDYEPGNCRWATRLEQSQNRASTVLLEHDGVRLSVSAWARRIGISLATLQCRIWSGWTVSDALTIPVDRNRKSSAHKQLEEGATA